MTTLVATNPIEGWEHELARAPDGRVADFNPSPREPDPRIWPLESDVGYDEFDPESDALYLICNPFPELHVRWVTEAQLRSETNDMTAEAAKRGYPPSLRLTPDRVEAFRRVAELFNGNRAGPDSCLLVVDRPGWMDLLDDLEGLDELTAEGKGSVESTLGEYDWYPAVGVFLKNQYLARSPTHVAPTHRAKVLINEHKDLPDLNGDPFEGLTHRFGVGLLVALAIQAPGTWATYVRIDGRIVDFVYDPPGSHPRQLYEVVTGHNNTKLHRSTYRKTKRLDGVPNYLFDSRSTAYRVFNHWQRKDLAEFPVDEFTSQTVDKGREATTTSYQRPGVKNTGIFDWQTLTQVWQQLFGTGGSSTETYPGSLFNEINTPPTKSTLASATW